MLIRHSYGTSRQDFSKHNNIMLKVEFKVDRLQIIVVAKNYICVVTVHQ